MNKGFLLLECIIAMSVCLIVLMTVMPIIMNSVQYSIHFQQKDAAYRDLINDIQKMKHNSTLTPEWIDMQSVTPSFNRWIVEKNGFRLEGTILNES